MRIGIEDTKPGKHWEDDGACTLEDYLVQPPEGPLGNMAAMFDRKKYRKIIVASTGNVPVSMVDISITSIKPDIVTVCINHLSFTVKLTVLGCQALSLMVAL